MHCMGCIKQGRSSKRRAVPNAAAARWPAPPAPPAGRPHLQRPHGLLADQLRELLGGACSASGGHRTVGTPAAPSRRLHGVARSQARVPQAIGRAQLTGEAPRALELGGTLGCRHMDAHGRPLHADELFGAQSNSIHHEQGRSWHGPHLHGRPGRRAHCSGPLLGHLGHNRGERSGGSNQRRHGWRMGWCPARHPSCGDPAACRPCRHMHARGGCAGGLPSNRMAVTDGSEAIHVTG